MADPITAGIGIAAIGGAVSSVMQGVAGYQQGQAQKETAQYNAGVLEQQSKQVQEAATATEAQQLRKSQGELGEQAAAFGQANVGTGPTVQGVERQSATDARLQALNTWYGGRIQGIEALQQARLEEYKGQVASHAGTMALISGGIGAATALGGGAAKGASYASTGIAPTF
jgi:hypothetical protein